MCSQSDYQLDEATSTHTSNINGGGTRTRITQRTFQLGEMILVLTQAPSYLDRASMLVIIGKH